MSGSLESRTADLESKVQGLQVTSAKGFAEVNNSCNHLKDELRKISEQQDKIFKLLYGNGREGLVTSIAKLNQKQGIVWTIFGVIGAAHMTFLTMAANDFLRMF